MAYTALTDSTHSKWWITGTGSVVNRLSEVMDDQADGPRYTTATESWTASAGDAAEYYHAPTKRPDNVYCAGVKLTEKADDTCIDGGGGGLADSEWCWETVNSRVYVQIAAGDPDGVTTQLYYDWNGGNSGTDFMTEVVEDVLYRIHLNFEIGDGSTATSLISNDECVFFHDCYFTLTAAATLSIGSLYNSYPNYGSMWFIDSNSASIIVVHYGTFTMYASILKVTVATTKYFKQYFSGATTIKRSIISGGVATSTSYEQLYTYFTNASTTLEDLMIIGGHEAFNIQADISITRVSVCGSRYGLYPANPIGTSIINTSGVDVPYTIVSGTKVATWDSDNSGLTVNVIDPVTAFTGSELTIGHSNTTVYLKYTINIHVTDKDGANLSGVTVDLEGSETIDYDTDAWTAGTVTTAADGTITEQTINVKKWVGTSETETDYNVFRFTISKTGYETLTLENITIDSPIDWHFELQPLKYPEDGWRHNV